MSKYEVMFVEQSTACNNNRLVCNDGEKRFFYVVEANHIEEAFLKAVELVRKDSKYLVRLNFCRLREEIKR